jgi:hypothetical protein
MNEDQEIKDIVNQLQSLQIRQTRLLTRLEHLNERAGVRTEENEARPARSAGPATRDPPRQLVVGDLVRIKNPSPFQITKGTITKINVTTDRITIQGKNGSKVVRATKNVTLQDER